jgi:hypothetical protein
LSQTQLRQKPFLLWPSNTTRSKIGGDGCEGAGAAGYRINVYAGRPSVGFTVE